MYECEVCEETFDSKKGRDSHRGLVHDLSPLEKFHLNVTKQSSDECWEWEGSYFTNEGEETYGRFIYRGEKYLAHRFIFQEENDLDLEYSESNRELVCHTCDNTRCVNPNHLYLGTPQDNMDDASNRGNLTTGEDNPASKVTKNIVRQLRAIYDQLGLSHRTLAEYYNISRGTIGQLLREETWTNATVPDSFCLEDHEPSNTILQEHTA